MSQTSLTERASLGPGDGLAGLGQPGMGTDALIHLGGDGEVGQRGLGITQGQRGLGGEVGHRPADHGARSHPTDQAVWQQLLAQLCYPLGLTESRGGEQGPTAHG